MRRILGLLLRVFLRLVIIIPPVVLAGMIAWNTSERVQPDENMHVDAFSYFETHWFRPPPDSDQVEYSPMGISRVYDGEIVYFLFGRIGYLVHQHWPDLDPFILYRFMNVGLLLVTLSVLAFARCSWFPPWLVALFLVCIPQVPYIYAYANSDGFGVTVSVFLFLATAKMVERVPRTWGWFRLLVFFVLFLGTLLAKVGFEMCILLPIALLAFHLIRTRTSPRFVVTRFVPAIVVIYVLAAWWNPALSPWHKQWEAELTQMKNDHAIQGRTPNGPHDWNYYEASEGWTYIQLLHRFDYVWLKRTGESFYSRFGAWVVQHPDWVFMVAGWIGLTGLGLTLLAQLIFRARLPWETMLCMLLAPPLIALNIYGSMYESLHVDFQPQGRYLFPSLIPIFFLFAGTWKIENKWFRWAHAMLFGVLLVVSYYSLLYYGALNETLRDTMNY